MKSILKATALVLVLVAGTIALPLTASAQTASTKAAVKQPDPAVIGCISEVDLRQGTARMAGAD